MSVTGFHEWFSFFGDETAVSNCCQEPMLLLRNFKTMASLYKPTDPRSIGGGGGGGVQVQYRAEYMIICVKEVGHGNVLRYLKI